MGQLEYKKKAKEKALELVEKFHSEIKLTKTSFAKAQDLADICVDEIMNLQIFVAFDIKPAFWVEVKKEINKL